MPSSGKGNMSLFKEEPESTNNLYSVPSRFLSRIDCSRSDIAETQLSPRNFFISAHFSFSWSFSPVVFLTSGGLWKNHPRWKFGAWCNIELRNDADFRICYTLILLCRPKAQMPVSVDY